MKEMGGSKGIANEVRRATVGKSKWCRALPRCATINDGVKASSSVSFFFFFFKKSYYDVFCEAGLQHYKS